MIVMCGKTSKGLEELDREEALELVEQLMNDGAHVQGESVREFAKKYDIFMPDPKDSLTHAMVQSEIIRLYANYVNINEAPDFELLDSGYEDDNLGWLVLGYDDRWSIEIGYDIEKEEAWLDGGDNLKEYFTDPKIIQKWLASIKRIAFTG